MSNKFVVYTIQPWGRIATHFQCQRYCITNNFLRMNTVNYKTYSQMKLIINQAILEQTVAGWRKVFCEINQSVCIGNLLEFPLQLSLIVQRVITKVSLSNVEHRNSENFQKNPEKFNFEVANSCMPFVKSEKTSHLCGVCSLKKQIETFQSECLKLCI